MPRDIFTEDIAPGAPTTLGEIKVLILYTLQSGPLPFEQLHEALREHDLVNYFELVRSLGELCESGHLSLEPQGELDYYRVTPLGEQNVRELERSLPAAVREKADRSRELVLKRQKRLSQVIADITGENGGFRLTLSLPDAGMDLVSFSVFTATREECERLRRRFLNAPLFIYKSVMELLSGSEDFLGEAGDESESLF